MTIAAPSRKTKSRKKKAPHRDPFAPPKNGALAAYNKPDPLAKLSGTKLSGQDPFLALKESMLAEMESPAPGVPANNEEAAAPKNLPVARPETPLAKQDTASKAVTKIELVRPAPLPEMQIEPKKPAPPKAVEPAKVEELKIDAPVFASPKIELPPQAEVPPKAATPQPVSAPAAQAPKPEAPKAQPSNKPAASKPAPTSKPAAASAPQETKPEEKREMSAVLFDIAERSQGLLKEFLERNRDMIARLPSLDPAHLSDAYANLASRLAETPDKYVEAQLAFWQDYARLMQGVIARLSGEASEPVIAPARTDKRFKDDAWQEVWLFDFIKQSYLLTARWAQSLVKSAGDLDPKIARKLDFYTRQMVDAVSPSNFILTNPAVLRTTLETNGENLITGFSNLLDDLERGEGRLVISMSDNESFRFGDNIAITPGKVVFQNELMQLLQFAPMTETVHKTPFLIVPPWINKYYILDLRQDNSFIRYLTEQGHTVYCVSWVNPDGRFAKVNFEDYMMQGPIAAMREIKRQTGEDELNILGYCIGGTLTATTLAWLKGLGDKRPTDIPQVKSATYLVTMVDFSEPGDLGVFIDEDQISAVEALMGGQGYMAAAAMNTTFSYLRANDLVWSFVINNYLKGQEPFPFDLLTWNSDSTNLPAAMQSFYLRNMYLENNLVKPGGITIAGVPIDLRSIDTPSFCLATRDDHITPWHSTYAATQIYGGKTSFVLSGSGHIAGVVNPPAKNKYGFWTNDNCPDDPEEWLSSAISHTGSWWPTWIEWLKPFEGGEVPPRDVASNPNALEDAPGSYVRVRVL